jgi:hypothetical protein
VVFVLVVVLEFIDLLPPLTFVVVVVVPVFELDDDVVDVAVLAGVMVLTGAVLTGFVFVLLAAVFVFVSPGQAAPNKPNVKTAERAITFFISIKFSCLLQRMYVYLFV